VETVNNGLDGIIVNGANSTGTINVSVSESVAAGNGFVGFFAESAAGMAATTLMVLHSVVANNVIGLQASGTGATVRLAHAMVTGNGSGWTLASGGVLQSYGDNYINGNTSNESPPPGIAMK